MHLPLYCHYSSQLEPQRAFITLDGRDGTYAADYDAEIGGGVPSSLWHGVICRIPAPALLLESYVEQYIDDVKRITEPARAGYEVIWNGNNHVGSWPHWTDDTDASLEIIYARYASDESCCASEYDVSDYLEPGRAEIAPLVAYMTDEEIQEKAAEFEHEAASSNVVLYGDVASYLRTLRDNE